MDLKDFLKLVKSQSWQVVQLAKATHYRIDDAHGTQVLFFAVKHSGGSKKFVLPTYCQELKRLIRNHKGQ